MEPLVVGLGSNSHTTTDIWVSILYGEIYLNKPRHGVCRGLVLPERGDGRDSVDFPGEAIPSEELMGVGGVGQLEGVVGEEEMGNGICINK